MNGRRIMCVTGMSCHVVLDRAGDFYAVLTSCAQRLQQILGARLVVFGNCVMQQSLERVKALGMAVSNCVARRGPLKGDAHRYTPLDLAEGPRGKPLARPLVDAAPPRPVPVPPRALVPPRADAPLVVPALAPRTPRAPAVLPLGVELPMPCTLLAGGFSTKLVSLVMNVWSGSMLPGSPTALL